MEVRNVAIVAHVDHGKTSLVDCLFREAGVLNRTQEGTVCLLDSNEQERERGITILSKNAAVTWRGVKINLIDTPGHADFGGQVERVLSMADGILLVVDAFEGPMPQTRFVLKKSFAAGLKPVVVLNKMDRQGVRPDTVIGELFDLFLDLGADEDLALDFPLIYSSARDGWSGRLPNQVDDGMAPLLDMILEQIQPPAMDDQAALQFQVSTLDWNDYVGRIAIGRVQRGILRRGDEVVHILNDGSRKRGKVKELYHYHGMDRVSCEAVHAGDIAALAGINGLGLGDTLCDPSQVEPLPPISIDPPTIEMEFLVNNSPLAGREGRFVTSRQVHERLQRAVMMDPALQLTIGPSGGNMVAGRGVLHLGILIETMRREEYEFAVGKPRVLTQEIDGKLNEPIEEAQIELPEDCVGRVIEFFGKRGAEFSDMQRRGETAVLFLRVPTRGMIGARTQILTLTRGEGVVSSIASGWAPLNDKIETRHNGVLIASEAGRSTAYSLRAFEDRGDFFIGSGEEVYQGMVIGENNRDNDMVLNIVRNKKLTNVRSANKDIDEKIRTPRQLGLEAMLEYVHDDELVEVTPHSLRLRKRHLVEKDRKRSGVQA